MKVGTSALVVVVGVEVEQESADYVSGLMAGAKGVILDELLTPAALEQLVISDDANPAATISQ